MSARRRRVWLSAGFAVCVFLLTGNFQAQGHEPQVIEFKVQKSKKSGTIRTGEQPEGDARVRVELFPLKEERESTDWILVVFPGMSIDQEIGGRPVANLKEIIEKKGVSPIYGDWENPGPLWHAYSNTVNILMPPGKSGFFDVFVDFLRVEDKGVSPRLLGKAYIVEESHVLALKKSPELIAQLVQNNSPDAEFVVDLYFRIKGTKWIAGTFEDIFGTPSKDERNGQSTGDYDKYSEKLPVFVNDYRSNLPLPGDFQDDGGRRFEETLSSVYKQGSGEAGQENCEKEDQLLTPLPKSSNRSLSPSHTLSGIFSTKWASDHALHPGFAWQVEAWTNETGSWQLLASDWVQSDGTWVLQVDSSKEYRGEQLRMYYKAYNTYFEPQNQAGNKYTWRDPDQTKIGSSFYAGHRFADTDGDAANGLGDLYDAGARLWSRLYWDGGINPVPASPLKLYYPNTWDNCGGSAPWSCANTSGEIWLIAAHGTQAPVVVHELSHQLNNKFWDNKRPAGAGGAHSLNTCYPAKLGMALREGFADFVPGWVGYMGRNVAEGGFNSTQWNLGYDLESRISPPSCTNGWENELWVARVFWDLHDTRSDGDDLLWFNHKGAVIALYLSNGIANDGDARDMRDYENVYRGAASAGHQGFISDIFNQNRH